MFIMIYVYKSLQTCAVTWSAQVPAQSLAFKTHTTSNRSKRVISAVTLPHEYLLKAIVLLSFYLIENTVTFDRTVKQIGVTKRPGYDFST